MSELHRREPNLNINKIILIGHSNGGDIAMLFAKEHPQLVKKLISLDSLRMPFPRNGISPILSLRANDTQADAGVLPSDKEARHIGIVIIKLENSKHIDLCDRGDEKTHKKINQLTLKFLNNSLSSLQTTK
ncbi:alpha/beta fold hydrolase [Legionella fairfieldensis]|uniref:alpha/beta fold hydrolase n=1 Tax=Legionella fairfieldensis TaxID=45064 RepID=UPI0006843E6C|nr:alpha/beta hydrolase [Legionella fairfieldensis]